IFDGWAAKREAPLVSFQRVGRPREEVVSVEKCIADEPKRVTVVLICPTLRYNVYRSAGTFPDVYARVAGLDAELLHRIREGERQGIIKVRVLVDSSIQSIHKVILAGAVHRELSYTACPLGTVALTAADAVRRLDTGHQERQIRQITPVQRQINYSLRIHSVLDRRVARLDSGEG